MHVMTQAPLRHGSGATDLIRSGGRPDLTLRGQWCEGRAFLAHALADACEHRGAVWAHNNARTWLTVTWRSPLLERAQRRHEGAAVPPECVNSGGRHDLNLRGRWLDGREYPTWITPFSFASQDVASHKASIPEASWSPLLVFPAGHTTHTLFTTFLFVPQDVASHVVSLPEAS